MEDVASSVAGKLKTLILKEIDMKRRIFLICITLMSFLMLNSLSAESATAIDDRDALRGVQKAKGLFDVAVSDAKRLEFNLKVIQRTYDGLVQQGQTPELIVAFRGPTVRLINTETWSFTEEDQETLKRVSLLLSTLKKQGVRFEACSVATGLFRVDNETILPEIKVVGNTFISLIGYQAQGFSLIPIK